MIFRKPYAILIKNFKLIHMIITILMCYLIYRTYAVNNFFNEYMKTSMLPLGRGASSQLFSVLMFTVPIILVIFSIIMFATMIKKQKPKTLYTFSIIVFSILFFLYYYVYNTVVYLEQNILTVREIRLCADLSIMILGIQLVLVVLSLIRSIGFDIKKFDFKKDLLDMDIVDEDNEEFEVSFSLDGNTFKRNFNKTIRNLKYTYLENKFIFRILALLAVAFLSFDIYKKSNLESKVLKENGEAFDAQNITMQVKNSYITKKDYKNTEITNGNFIIVKMDALASKSGTKLNYARMQLKVGNTVYYPKEGGYIEEFIDLGKVYADEFLTTKSFQSYLIVYELPLSVNPKNITFRYITDSDGDKTNMITIALKPINLDKEKITMESKINQKVILNKTVLGETKIKINSFEINDHFVQTYKYCSTSGDCYSSKEYLRPVLNTRYDKALIKINGSLEFDENYNIYGVSNLANLINKFGTIVYKKNGNMYKVKGDLSWVEGKKYTKKNEYYLEINKAILDSEYAYLLIQIRDKEYKYIIKNEEIDKKI